MRCKVRSHQAYIGVELVQITSFYRDLAGALGDIAAVIVGGRIIVGAGALNFIIVALLYYVIVNQIMTLLL